MKVGGKTNFGRLATIFQICSMDADIPLNMYVAQQTVDVLESGR